jgi:type VI secretion system protein ImpK
MNELTYQPNQSISSLRKDDLEYSNASGNHLKNSQTIANPLIKAINPTLSLLTYIKGCDKPPKLNTIREMIINEIQQYETTLEKLGYDKKIRLAIRYCLCTFIDESILRTDWGTQTLWVQHTLLSYFHNETWGGERFYIILDTLAKNPRQHISVIELLYLLLSLGFEGKYYDQQHQPLREEIINNTFLLIKSISGKQSRQLSTHTQDLSLKIIQKSRRHLTKLYLFGITSVLTIMIVIFNINLHHQSSSIIKRLNSLATTPAVATYSQLVDRSIYNTKEDS